MSGRSFMQIPGPTNIPDRILRAMDRPVVDHRGPEFARLTQEILPPLRQVFGTADGSVVIYPTSGTGAWEAALVNVLSPGDRVLAFNYGHFSALFARAARRLGFVVDEVDLRWGQDLPGEAVEERLRADNPADPYKAVLVVHNETSTGVTTNVPGVRKALNATGHKALLIVDAVSSLASIDFQFDRWGVDVALAGSQKGLMLPPGIGVLCVGPRALVAAAEGGSPRSFFDWRPILVDNQAGFFPYTPPILMLFGLNEALRMLVLEEGLPNVFDRHHRLASGVRAAVSAWGLRLLCESPRNYSDTLSAVVMPDGIDSDRVIAYARDNFGLALGVGLSRIKGKVLRIGHLGALNELEVLATLGGIEMAFQGCGVEVEFGSGVAACQEVFAAGPSALDASMAAGWHAKAPSRAISFDSDLPSLSPKPVVHAQRSGSSSGGPESQSARIVMGAAQKGESQGSKPGMSYWVVGAGAIGCVLGAKLADRSRVVLVDSWRDHVDAIRSKGLTVDYPEQTVHVNLPAFHFSEMGSIPESAQVILLAVKSNQTEATVKLLEPYLSDKAMVVSIQNCINEEAIASMVGAGRTIGAMVRFDGTLHGPGHASSTQRARRLVLGELDGSISERLRVLADELSSAVSTETTSNIWGQLWTKMVRNSELNAVAALTGFLTDEIARDPLVRRVALSLGMETVRVALKLGMELDPAELYGAPESYLQPLGSAAMEPIEREFLERGTRGPGVKASMLQDVEKGRPTEIDYMNGYVVDKGRQVGVSTPVNEAVVRLVKEAEAHRRAPNRGVVEEFFAELVRSQS